MSRARRVATFVAAACALAACAGDAQPAAGGDPTDTRGSTPDTAPSHRAREWEAFARRYRAEMKRPAAERLIALLAALSHDTNFSVGCYCEDESRCHRSILRMLLKEHGAKVIDAT